MQIDFTSPLILSLIAILLLSILIGVLTTRPARTKPPTDLPYEREPHLLTRGEQAFYEVLRQAAPGHLHIFTKVRLIDLVRVRPGTPNPQSHKNRVMSKHVDFVLCSPDTFAPLLVIELDDSSHQRPNRQSRDAAKDAILKAAGIPILRVPASSSYNRRDLSQAIHTYLTSTPHSTSNH